MKGILEFLLGWGLLVVIGVGAMFAYDWYESQLSAKDLIGTYDVIEVGRVGHPPMKLERGQYKMFINGTNEPNKLFIGAQKPKQEPDPFVKFTFDGEYLVNAKVNAMLKVTFVKDVGYKLLTVNNNQYSIIVRN